VVVEEMALMQVAMGFQVEEQAVQQQQQPL
jgi:hypothetical protein